jgi:phage repressor protein C with HTH and peptisase S24 domain
MRYNALLDRLQNLINHRPSQKELGTILGIAQTSVSGRANRNSNFTDEELVKIEDWYAIAGLLTGSFYTKNDINVEYVTLDFYPDVFGSCGTGCMVFSEAKEKLAVTKDIITNYSASNQYSIISARGSSMSPTINDEDKLVIQHNLNEQIIDDTVYLFKYNDELFIKRLVKNVDQIVCISENPRFQDRIIEPKGDNFSIIGKVVGLFRSKV